MKFEDIFEKLFFVFISLGAAVGGAAGIYFIWGGFHPPAGRYPIILLLLLFVGPPVIGAAVGFFGTAFLAIGIGWTIRKRNEAVAKRKAIEENRNKGALFHRAIAEGDVSAVEAALKKDERIDTVPVNSNGNFALHVAAKHGQAQMVETLMSERTPWQHRNKDGKLFFELAPSDKTDVIWNAFYRSYARRLAKVFGQQAREALYEQWLRHWLATQFDEAIAHSTLKAPRVAQGFAELAAVAAGRGHRQQAMSAVEAALELDAKNAEALLRRAQLRLETGDEEGAFRDANAVLHATVISQHADGMRGIAFEVLGRKDDALKAYHKALESDPGNEFYQQRLNELIMS